MITCGCSLDKGVCEEGKKLEANLSRLAQAPERFERWRRGLGDSDELNQAQEAFEGHLDANDVDVDDTENCYLWLG